MWEQAVYRTAPWGPPTPAQDESERPEASLDVLDNVVTFPLKPLARKPTESTPVLTHHNSCGMLAPPMEHRLFPPSPAPRLRWIEHIPNPIRQKI
jgi:hypothetical protein